MAATLAAYACNKGTAPIPDDALVVVGKSVLTRADLDRSMPGGLNDQDSTLYAQAYIKSWIDAEMTSKLASREIDMTEIDKMVAEYRNQLIMLEYSRQMYDSHGKEYFSEDSIKRYYDEHKDEFILTRPMVKGVYLKVFDDAKSLPQLRKLYKSTKDQDVDKLDKSELTGAVHYDYFRDRWVDWEQIERRIPYDFGSAPSTFLRNHRNLDFSTGGFTYLLDISDVLYEGQTMPYEAARSQIEDRLKFASRRLYDDALKKELYDKGVQNGDIKILYE